MNWIYIAGRGHSGSTILDIILGNNCEVESCGEIISAIDRLDHNCSCGNLMKNCPFWSSVIADFYQKDPNWFSHVKILKNKSHIKYWMQLFVLGHYPKEQKLLKSVNDNLFLAIQSQAKTKWILDSSKELTRALFILTTNPEAKIIHLIKNPVDIANSYKKRFVQYGYFYFLRKLYRSKKYFFLFAAIVGLSWNFGNLMMELMRLKYKKRIIRIKYEDFVENYNDTVNKLTVFIGCDFTDILTQNELGKPFLTGHNIGGNHLKAQKEVFIKKTDTSERIINRLERLMVKITSFPLRWVYGY